MGTSYNIQQIYCGDIEAHNTTVGASLTIPNSERIPSLAEIPQHVESLFNAAEDDNTKVHTIEELLLVAARRQRGANDLATAILDAHAIPKMVEHLKSDSDKLARGVIGLFAWSLRYPQTWDAALRTDIMALLMKWLHDPSLQTKIDAACTLAHITGKEEAKRRATEVEAVQPLVDFLAHTSPVLRQMATRALRNIASIDVGRKAVYEHNAVPGLVANLDFSSTNRALQLDIVMTLSELVSTSKAAKSVIKECGTVAKLKGYSRAPKELEEAVWELKDKLGSSIAEYLCHYIRKMTK